MVLALRWTFGLAFGWAHWALFRFPGLGWVLDRPVASALTKETRTRRLFTGHRRPEARERLGDRDTLAADTVTGRLGVLGEGGHLTCRLEMTRDMAE